MMTTIMKNDNADVEEVDFITTGTLTFLLLLNEMSTFPLSIMVGLELKQN